MLLGRLTQLDRYETAKFSAVEWMRKVKFESIIVIVIFRDLYRHSVL